MVCSDSQHAYHIEIPALILFLRCCRLQLQKIQLMKGIAWCANTKIAKDVVEWSLASNYIPWLVGSTPQKILVNMDDYDYSQCMETCSKPPTSSKWPPTEVRTLNWTHYLSGSVFSGMRSSIQGWIPRSQEVSSISYAVLLDGSSIARV